MLVGWTGALENHAGAGGENASPPRPGSELVGYATATVATERWEGSHHTPRSQMTPRLQQEFCPQLMLGMCK